MMRKILVVGDLPAPGGRVLPYDGRADARSVATHTIAFALPYCEFELDNRVIFGTEKVRDGDSKLLTLIHEVTHFDDTFSSNDTWYGTLKSRNQVNSQNLAALRVNADSIAAYILGVDPKASK